MVTLLLAQVQGLPVQAPNLSVAMYFTSERLLGEDPDLVLPKWPADINTESVATIAALARKENVLPGEPDIADLMPQR